MGDVPSRFLRPLTASEAEELARLARSSRRPVGVRAQIVLMSAAGVAIPHIMRRLRVSRPTVVLWLSRFERSGARGLLTQPRSGRPRKVTPDVEQRIAVVAGARPRDVGWVGATWSLRALRAFLVSRGGTPPLALESVRAALRRRGLTTVRTGTTRKGATMIPAAFEYHTPRSLGEATDLLGKLGDEAKILSGGQSLIPLMKLRLARPRHLVDINGIPGLAYVREADGFLKIGALTRESDLEKSEVVQARYPLLHDTCAVIADPIVRNLATIGGNLAHADPANDHPAAMLAYGAEVTAVGRRGERRIAVSAFFTGPFATALAADEILTEIRIPVPTARTGGAYLKLERKVGDFATAAVAVQLTLDASGVCERVGIGLTSVGLTSIKADRAEQALRSKRLDDAAIRQAAQLASEQAQPSADLRGSVEYKRDLVRVLTARALRKAAERAGLGR